MRIPSVDHGERYSQLSDLWWRANNENRRQLGRAIDRGDEATERRMDNEHKVLDRVRESLLNHPGR